MPPMTWAKISAGFFANRKVRQAGHLGASVFVHVLCSNAGRDASGAIPRGELEPVYVADMLRMTVAEAVAGITAAMSAGLFAMTETEIVICGWDQDWGRRVLTEAERKKAYRARIKHMSGQLSGQCPDIGHAVWDMSGLSDIREEKRREDQTPLSPLALSGHVPDNRGTSANREVENAPLLLSPGIPTKPPRARRARKPKDEPTTLEAAQVAHVLEKLAERTGKGFGGDKEHRRLVLSLLRAGNTVWDLRRVIAYCGGVRGWDDAPKPGEKDMRIYMTPTTLFGPKNFAKYLGDAVLAIPADAPPDAIITIPGDHE